MFGPLAGQPTPLGRSRQNFFRLSRRLGPEHWFRFNEPLLSTTLINYGSLGTGFNGTGSNTVSGQAGQLTSPGAWAFNNAVNAIVTIPGGAWLNNTAWTHAMLINPTDPGQNGSGSLWSTSSAGAYHSRFGLNSFNTIRCERTTSATTAVAESNAGGISAALYWVFWTFTTATMTIHEYKGKAGVLTELTYGTQQVGTGTLSDRHLDSFVLGNETGLGNAYHGTIHQYMEFNYVLSAAQMTALIQQSRV